MDADWHAFCQALYKGIEGEDYDAYKETSRTVGGCPESKSLWKMKAAKDAGEEYCDPTHEDNILRRNKARLALLEEHLKNPIVALDKAMRCVENSYQKVVARVLCGGSVLQWPLLASSKVCGESRSGRAVGHTCIRWTVCVYAQHPWSGKCQGSVGRMASSFSF